MSSPQPSTEALNLQEWQRVMRLAEGCGVMLHQITQEISERPTKDPAAPGIQAGNTHPSQVHHQPGNLE